MTDIFDGDPLIILDDDGAEMSFSGGQPLMDTGFINHINFALLTEEGWWGNDIEPDNARKIGSQYLKAASKPITRQMLIDADRAAESDAKGEEFGTVLAVTTNPTSQNLFTDLTLTPPTRDPVKLRLERFGQNWINQAGLGTKPIVKPPGGVIHRERFLILTDTGKSILADTGEAILGLKQI